MHVDRLPTHIISAILQIDQKVDKDWPLTLIDHEGGKKKGYCMKVPKCLMEGYSRLMVISMIICLLTFNLW